MAVSLKIDVQTSWIRKEADGQECACCGDRCFLFHVWVVKVEMPSIGFVYESPSVVCDSCFSESSVT